MPRKLNWRNWRFFFNSAALSAYSMVAATMVSVVCMVHPSHQPKDAPHEEEGAPLCGAPPGTVWRMDGWDATYHVDEGLVMHYQRLWWRGDLRKTLTRVVPALSAAPRRWRRPGYIGAGNKRNVCEQRCEICARRLCNDGDSNRDSDRDSNRCWQPRMAVRASCLPCRHDLEHLAGAPHLNCPIVCSLLVWGSARRPA